MVGSRQLWQESVSLTAKNTNSSETTSQGRRFHSSTISSQHWGCALVRLAACWWTDGSSNHLHIIISQGPALSQEEFPGITVQMLVCNEPSGVSGFNVSPQRDSHYCVRITCLFGGLSALRVGMRWGGDAISGNFTISCVSVCDWVRIAFFVGYQTDSFSLCRCSVQWCCLYFPAVIQMFFFFFMKLSQLLTSYWWRVARFYVKALNCDFAGCCQYALKSWIKWGEKRQIMMKCWLGNIILPKRWQRNLQRPARTELAKTCKDQTKKLLNCG